MILYRGFNNNYPKTLGVKPEQKGIWMTDDEEYANEYAMLFKNGAIAEIDIDDDANIANVFDCEEAFRDNEDFRYGEDFGEYLADLGGNIEFDNKVCDTLFANGYDGVMFDDYDKECYYIFNRKVIKGYKIIKTLKNDREDAMESTINNILKNAGVKPLNEAIYFNDEVFNDWNDQYEQLKVLLNPSIDWLRNELNKPHCYGFRFLHNTQDNLLYVWDCKHSFTHEQVFNIVDMKWGKGGTNVVGIFDPGSILVWEALSPDGYEEESIKLALKLDKKLFDELYPNGYKMGICY